MDSPFTYDLSDLNISLTKRLRGSGLKEKTKLSVNSMIVTFLSTSFGIGFLSIPISTALSGLLYFIGLCFLTASIKYQANYALVVVGQKYNAKNYPVLVSKVLEKSRFAFLIHLLMFLSIFGTIVAYTLAIQQSLSACFSYLSATLNQRLPSYLGSLTSRTRFNLLGTDR